MDRWGIVFIIVLAWQPCSSLTTWSLVAAQTPTNQTPALAPDELPTPGAARADEAAPAEAQEGTKPVDDEQPSSAIIVLPPGSQPPASFPENQAALSRIAEMLQRSGADAHSFPSDGQSPPSADPLLNDVLEIIRQRGSVLNGSSLDEPEQTHDSLHSDDLPMQGGEPGAVARDPSEHRYRTAESLLRSARLLGQIAAQDPEQQSLVRAMRQRALVLLIQAAKSQAPTQPVLLPSEPGH